MVATCKRVALRESCHGVALRDIFLSTPISRHFINKDVSKPAGPQFSCYDPLSLLIMQSQVSLNKDEAFKTCFLPLETPCLFDFTSGTSYYCLNHIWIFSVCKP